MTVDLQFAERHLEELIQAAERGEDVAIAQPGKQTLHLTAEPVCPEKAKPLWGIAAGQIRIADDSIHPR